MEKIIKIIKNKISWLFLLSTFVLSNGFDTLSYYEKFDSAVISYKQNRYSLAEKQFKNILINDKAYRDPAAQLMMAKSQYQLKLYENALRSSKVILSTFSNSPYEIDALILLGDIVLSQGKATKAFKYYLEARTKIENLLYLNTIDERIYKCIGIGVKQEVVEGILFREKDKFNREIINLSRAYQAWMNGDLYDLEIIIDEINTFNLPGHFSGLYGALKDKIESNLNKVITIAVLLPLSGLEREKGLAYLFGLSEFMESQSEPSSVRFLIYDTAGSAVNVLRIMNQLLSNPKIIAVLGPITKDEILSLSGMSAQLPILVPKSAISGLPEIAENLFFLAPSANTIAKRTAQMIIKELQLENIAVLSPGVGDVKLLTDRFLDECHQLGVNPVTVEWYIEKPEDISRQFKNIRSVAWSLIPDAEPDDNTLNLEIDSLDALFDVDVADFFELPFEEKEIMDKKDSAKITLESIQALYIPIRPEELTYIGTQLPFYNLNSVLFGNENWLDMPVLNQEIIGPHVSGMYIVSDVNSAISNENIDFFSNYSTLAFDHALFIQSMNPRGIINRRTFLQKLRTNTGFYGEHTCIIFTGKNKNENGSVQVLQYLNKQLKDIGIYDGESLMQNN